MSTSTWNGLIRIRAGACISNPVGADVGRIEAPKIRPNEDKVGAGARRVRVNRHALSRASGVGERVRIVMARKPIAEGRARRTGRAGLRNTAAEQAISLRRIASVDASRNYNRSAARATGRRWCGCRSAAATTCPIDPVHLVWHSRVDTAISIPSTPTDTNTKATTRVLPRCTLVGLHCPVSPTPLTLSGKGQVGLDLDPIRACTKHGSRAQVYCECRAAYRHRLVKCTDKPASQETPRYQRK